MSEHPCTNCSQECHTECTLPDRWREHQGLPPLQDND
jgi:hypothetical protein